MMNDIHQASAIIFTSCRRRFDISIWMISVEVEKFTFHFYFLVASQIHYQKN